MTIKLKLLQPSTMKAKAVTRLVGQVEAGNGITVVKAGGDFTVSVNSGSGIFQLADADLTALANNSTNGFWARTGVGTGAARTLTGTANEITVANGDGSGVPTFSLPSALTFTGKTITGGTYASVTSLAAGGLVTGSNLPLPVELFGVTTAASAATNSTNIATAISTAIAQGGRPLQFGVGTYNFASTITLTGALAIAGAGHSLTTLSFAAGVTGITTGAHTHHIRNLQINTTGVGIALGSGLATHYFSLIERVYFLGPSVGIAVSQGSVTRIINCDFNAFTIAGITIDAPLNPDEGDSLILGNYFLAAGGATASIYQTGGGGWKITDNKMLGGSYGYFLNAAFGANASSSLIISNNSIEGTTGAMLAFANSDGLGAMYRIVIEGNQGGGDGRGIAIEDNAGAAWIQHLDISGNLITMHDLATSAIYVEGVTHLGVSGNVIDCFGTGATAVVITSTVNGGHVDLSFTDNFTTRYTNASANVFVTDIQGNFALAAGKTFAINNTVTLNATDGAIVSFGNNFQTLNNSIILTATGATNVTLPTTGTLPTLAGAEAFTNKTYNGNTWTAGTGTLTIAAGKTLTASATLTLTGTDGAIANFGNNFQTAAALSLPAVVQGDLWYGSAAGVIAALAKDTNASRFLKNSGTNNNPAWVQPAASDLSDGTTGTGAVVRATSPTLVTPALGTPSAINLANATFPAIVSFSAHKNGTDQTNLVNATFTKITFGTELYDQGSAFDTTNSRWTPTAGIVQISAGILLTTNIAAGTICQFALYKNGANHRETLDVAAAAGNKGIALSVVDTANGTDYYELFVWHNAGADVTASGLAICTFFTGGVIR